MGVNGGCECVGECEWVLCTCTDEQISNMSRELAKYGIQMPAFSKIGGILANEVRDSLTNEVRDLLANEMRDALENEVKNALANEVRNALVYDRCTCQLGERCTNQWPIR